MFRDGVLFGSSGRCIGRCRSLLIILPRAGPGSEVACSWFLPGQEAGWTPPSSSCLACGHLHASSWWHLASCSILRGKDTTAELSAVVVTWLAWDGSETACFVMSINEVLCHVALLVDGILC